MNNDDRIVELLEELVVWTRFGNRAELLQVWDAVLKDDKHLLAYELSDGLRTQKEVGDGAALSQPVISGLWQKWLRLGIARIRNGRAAHIARPSEMGMERAERVVAAAKLRPAATAQPADSGGQE